MTNLWHLAVRTFAFYWRSHAGTLAGTALATTVLTGALIVGDSIRGSLRQSALARVGRIQWAAATPDRFFRTGLAAEIEKKKPASMAASVLFLLGTASSQEGAHRANQVHLFGVGEDFWKLAPHPPNLPEDGVAVNQALARQLSLHPGDGVILRFEKPGLISRDLPLSSNKDRSLALRVIVTRILSADELADFSLQASQIPALNIFLPLKLLQARIEQPGRANLVLLGTTHPETGSSAQQIVDSAWTLEDSQLSLVQSPGGTLELRSQRVFLDPIAVQTATNILPVHAKILTYFINEIRHKTKSTPYSMVAAVEGLILPDDCRDDQIVINQWLADDLGVQTGDLLSLRYFVSDGAGRLLEQTNDFSIHSIIPLQGDASDRTLMPDFPGLARAESSHDWDTGFPIDLQRIRSKDEDYWKQYRGTPKAFIRLRKGTELWSNRFGNLTSIRLRGSSDAAQPSKMIESKLRSQDFGVLMQPVRQQALAAANQSEDFGQLFLGFSFFLIAAALILTSLLFQLSLEQRARETGLLLAFGFQAAQLRILFLLEGLLLALTGSAIGTFLGLAYAKAMLWGLATIWRSAVGTSTLALHYKPVTLALGCLSGMVVALFTIWLSFRRQIQRRPTELLARGEMEPPANRPRKRFFRSSRQEASESIPGHRPSSRALPLAAILALLSLALLGWTAWSRKQDSAPLFFGASTLLLLSGMALTAYWLRRLGNRRSSTLLTWRSLGLSGAGRRRKRSLAAIALFGAGAFLIISVGANKLPEAESDDPSGGTGGFNLIANATVPVLQDLNNGAARDSLGLDETLFSRVGFIPFRVRDGDDASCLNLNRAQIPRLLGVNAGLLAQRHAFTFASSLRGQTNSNSWLLLKNPAPSDEVYAVGDAASIRWALHKNVGDVLDYVDEGGRSFKVRIVGTIANSVLQGNLIVDEKALLTRFPSLAGYRMFLINAPSNQVGQVSSALQRSMADAGLAVTTTSERLAAFNAVQNTYLNTFQVLGGLGLLLGTAGLAAIVFRNILERRGELALLAAVGITRSAIVRMVLLEHSALLILGLILGIGSGAISMVPLLFQRGTPIPFTSLALTMAAVLSLGIVWTFWATRHALKGNLLAALHNN